MSYFLVANFDVIDQEMFDQYRSEVGPTMMKYGAKVLVVDHAPNDIEEGSRNTLVILEFESEAVMMRWYNSPEYQAIIKLRINATEGWMRGAPQFEMPSLS